MKLKDTLTLLRAGYTKEEIAAMESGKNDQHAEDLNLSASADNNSLAASKQVTGKAKEQDTSAEAQSSAQTKDPAPKSAGTDDSRVIRVMDAIDRLTLAIQKMNITNSNIQGGDQEQAPEDIIAQIINPPLPKRGGK